MRRNQLSERDRKTVQRIMRPAYLVTHFMREYTRTEEFKILVREVRDELINREKQRCNDS